MTGRGIAFTAFFVMLSGAAAFTGSREIALTALSMGLLLGYGIVSAVWMALCVRYRVQTPSSGLIRGDQASFTIEISGFRLFPVVLYLQVGTGDDVFPRCAFQLSIGGNPQSFCVPIECPHRGIWQMQLRRLKVRDLFGFFSLPLLDFFRHREELHTLAVYPRLHASGSIRTRLPKDTAYSEDHLIPADTGDSSAGVRAYRQGDSLKQIHWKITAKMRELYSKQYEIPAEPYALVLLDHVWTGRQGGDPLDRSDLLCECAGEIVLHHALREEAVCLQVPGMANGEIRLEGKAEIPSLYEFLTVIPWLYTPELAQKIAGLFQHLDAIHTLYVVTDRMEDDIRRGLTGIAHRLPVVWVMPDAGREESRIELEDGLYQIAVPRAEQVSVWLEGGL